VKDSVFSKVTEYGKDEVGYPAEVYPYSAGVIGGLLGGAAMGIPAIAYGFLSGHGPWYPLNLIAATVIPGLQDKPPQFFERFDLAMLIIALIIHLIVATSLGLTFAVLLPMLPGRPEIWALIVGPLLWFGATFAILPVLDPVMSRVLDWPSFALANLVYGLIMGTWVAHTPRVDGTTPDFYRRFYWPSFIRE
jgi:hypothetical protein